MQSGIHRGRYGEVKGENLTFFKKNTVIKASVAEFITCGVNISIASFS